MNKILLTTIFSFLTFVSYSQIYATAVNLTIGIRDNKYDSFTWGETKEVDDYIPVKIEGKDIIIYTEDVQYYQTLMPEYHTDDRKGSYWYAVDDNMKRCKFYMYNNGLDFLMIEYDDVCIIYGVVYK
jgi:hypothetical protein